ncbi:hypothetical protein C2S52_021115 [Perilla frutescens var. hirtella]|nr:hypothetical protein C2S52_021115 [Perilla frutescens var. hirtella]
MSEAEEVKLYIKVVINKEKTTVLFAEAGSDFIDILLSFLLLPLGTIVKVVEKHYGDKAPAIGSFSTLYNGIANLDSVHFNSESAKSLLLNPISNLKNCWRRLKLNYTDPTSSNFAKEYDGVFTKSADSLTISDDLQVIPNVAGSIINTLSNLSIAITDMDGAETRNVTFGFNEMMALLKEALISRNPLTALLLGGSQMNLAAVKYERGNALLTQIDKDAASVNPKKMILKVMIQKSTFKLLFAQADSEFINLLFSLLTLPKGRVEWYLGSNTGLKNMDSLHRSIAVDNFDKHLRELIVEGSRKTDYLINPAVYDIYRSSNEFSPLNFSQHGSKFYLEGSRMYMVSDDITVVPLTITSSISIINKMKIPLSDVRELELQVGLEEGLSILKAALTSSTALTDSLIQPMFKNPKQES